MNSDCYRALKLFAETLINQDGKMNCVEQAKAFCQLYDEAGTALANYTEKRSPEESDRFFSILARIETEWLKLRDCYVESSTDPDRVENLALVTNLVRKSLFRLQRYKEDADNGIVRIVRGAHFMTRPADLIKMDKAEILGCILRDRSLAETAIPPRF